LLTNKTKTTRDRQRSRRALAPVELVLWLPVLLMVMALIVNYANMTSWRVRGEIVARDAVWRSRWPRSGSVEPRPPTTVWPSDAGMGVRSDAAMWALNHPNIHHPVVRGPVLELGDPPHRFLVRPLLDQEVGAVAGTSSIRRRQDLLPALGDYRSGEIADRMLTRTWQCAHMGFSNHYRRTLVLYELPQTPPALPEAYVRSVMDLIGIPHFAALSVLDRDFDWHIYYGSYPNFYPRISPNYGETDPLIVYDRSVKPKIDRIDEDGDVVLGEISRLPRRMTDAYLRMYEAVKREIEQLEQELTEIPPPDPVRREWIINRLARLRQIEDLDLKIEQLKRDQMTLDAREQQMENYFLLLMSSSD
jgi:hypothetical protein